MYLPTYHHLSYKSICMQSPPTFAKNYTAASSQHHRLTWWDLTHTTHSAVQVSHDFQKLLKKLILFPRNVVFAITSDVTASTHSCKPHARCLAEWLQCTATLTGRNWAAAMLFGKGGAWLWCLPSSFPRARKSLWSPFSCLNLLTGLNDKTLMIEVAAYTLQQTRDGQFFFQGNFCHQWSLTIQCADEEGWLWVGECWNTHILFFWKKNPSPELYLLAVRQGWKSGTIQQAKRTLRPLLALNFYNPVKGSAHCNLFSSPSPCLDIMHVITAVLSPGKISLSLFFPSLPTGYTTGLEAAVCLLGFLPTHGSGRNFYVLMPSHSPCSCSSLEGWGRMFFVSHPVKRSLQGLSACTQGRTPSSEHKELWM